MGKQKVVLDTNVLVSGIGWEGVPAKILDACIKGELDLVISLALIEELNEILLRKKFNFIDHHWKRTVLSLLMENSDIVYPKIKIDLIAEDPEDNKIIECALSGKADYIISGDKHLLGLKNVGGIKIVKPAIFFQEMQKC